MGLFSWFSADVDTGKVVAKTDVKSNGKVSRYEYTEPDNIEAGHGHKEYDSLEDFLEDNPSFERDKYDEESLERIWRGNGIILTKLSRLSYEELQELEAMTGNEYIKHSARFLLERENSDDFSRKLSL